MICPRCNIRWAPFFSVDFYFIEGEGFIPKNTNAEKTRKIMFDSTNKQHCGCKKDDELEISFYSTCATARKEIYDDLGNSSHD